MSSLPRVRDRRLGLAALMGSAFAALSVCSLNGADPALADPGYSFGQPVVLSVGAAQGASVSDRVDSARTGRTSAPLPRDPVELWRRGVSGGLDSPPVVTKDGSIIAALTVPEVVMIDRDGRERWRAKTGASAALAPPAMTNDGGVVVATTDGRAWAFDAQGKLKFQLALGVRGRDVVHAPLALDDGGFVVAAGRDVVFVDATGAIRGSTSLSTRVAGPPLPVPSRQGSPGGGVLLATERGDVLSFAPPGTPRQVGSLGARPREGLVLADERTVMAVVEGDRLVALDLRTGVVDVRSGGLDPTFQLDAPVAVAADGTALLTTFAGLLVGLDKRGDEIRRVALEQRSGGQDAGPITTFFGSVDLKPSPPIVVDREGRVGFVRRSGQVGVVQPDDTVVVAADRLCGNPIALVPAGDRRMLLACRDGSLWMLGDRP